MFKKKKSFNKPDKKTLLSYLFTGPTHNNGETDCCSGTQSGSCHDNGDKDCCIN